MSLTNVPVPMVPVEVIVREPFDALYHREFAGLVRLAMVQVDSQEQIAEILEVPIGTVKSTLHRAIVRLREEVTE